MADPDIFAQHARSREGKAQVALAQMNYMLPRLRGWGDAMSRQAGGIGTRGPGETKIETDRRRIRARIAKLRRELAAMGTAREVARASSPIERFLGCDRWLYECRKVEPAEPFDQSRCPGPRRTIRNSGSDGAKGADTGRTRVHAV